MKLIYAIVNNSDTKSVCTALVNAGYYATKLASTGGFLSSGSTTFLIGVEDDKVDNVIAIISEKSRRRKQFVPFVNSVAGVGYISSPPIEVSVGGATIFVTDVERYEKV